MWSHPLKVVTTRASDGTRTSDDLAQKVGEGLRFGKGLAVTSLPPRYQKEVSQGCTWNHGLSLRTGQNLRGIRSHEWVLWKMGIPKI